MRKLVCLGIALIMMLGAALADQAVALPGERYSLTVPDEMEYSPKNTHDSAQSPYFQYAYYSSKLELEMDVFVYPNGGITLQRLAEEMAAKGQTVEIRRISGQELLCYMGQDSPDTSDGAPYIGYVLMDGDQAIEITFWYATQKGMDKTAEIMNTLR